MVTTTPTPLTFVVASPQELTDRLKETPAKSPFAALAISGSQILVRAFQFKDLSLADTKSRLQAEAVELLSVPFSEIEFDYQVFGSAPERTAGVYLAMPRKLLREYLAVFDNAKFIPIKMTAAILATIDSFCQKRDIAAGRCCLLDLSNPSKIHAAIFMNKQCEFIREIPYDNLEEARVEIIQTLRSASAASTVKQVEQIYWAGDLQNKEDLLRQIEKISQAKIEQGPALDMNESLASESGFFNLNLLKRFSFSLSERSKVIAIMDKALAAVVIGCVLLTAGHLSAWIGVKKVKSSYKASDYEYAKKLEKQLKSLRK